MSVVIFVVVVLGGLRGADGQSNVTDADLLTASAGRVVRVGNQDTGRLTATLPLEVYVARVLAGEGEPRAGDAAQQAVAVAIRTYVLANSGRHRRDGFDLCDSTHCQVLRQSTPTTRRAALATAGQVLLHEGRPAEVFYSASCGGHSEAAAEVWPGANYPYLRANPDDVHEGDTPWTLDLTLAQIESALRRVGFTGDLSGIEIEARSASGRVTRLRLEGLQPGVVAGEQFRMALGALVLRSTAFTLTTTAGGARFVGRGFGHGIGMCVVGAGRRAARGETSRAILAQYYPGLQLASATPVLTRATPVTPGVPARPAPAPAAAVTAAIVPPRNTGIIVRASGSSDAVAEAGRVATRAYADLSQRLGVSIAPVTIDIHNTLEEFRLATGQPWWVTAVARGMTIDLAPLPVLSQGDGIERAVRMAVGELLMADAMAGKPAWVKIGGARYFAQPSAAAGQARVRCPSDAELTLAISATAQREAEARAEACFARAISQTNDWRAVR